MSCTRTHGAGSMKLCGELSETRGELLNFGPHFLQMLLLVTKEVALAVSRSCRCVVSAGFMFWQSFLSGMQDELGWL